MSSRLPAHLADVLPHRWWELGGDGRHEYQVMAGPGLKTKFRPEGRMGATFGPLPEGAPTEPVGFEAVVATQERFRRRMFVREDDGSWKWRVVEVGLDLSANRVPAPRYGKPAGIPCAWQHLVGFAGDPTPPGTMRNLRVQGTLLLGEAWINPQALWTVAGIRVADLMPRGLSIGFNVKRSKYERREGTDAKPDQLTHTVIELIEVSLGSGSGIAGRGASWQDRDRPGRGGGTRGRVER